jgi:hypothetical protein
LWYVRIALVTWRAVASIPQAIGRVDTYALLGETCICRQLLCHGFHTSLISEDPVEHHRNPTELSSIQLSKFFGISIGGTEIEPVLLSDKGVTAWAEILGSRRTIAHWWQEGVCERPKVTWDGSLATAHASALRATVNDAILLAERYASAGVVMLVLALDDCNGRTHDRGEFVIGVGHSQVRTHELEAGALHIRIIDAPHGYALLDEGLPLAEIDPQNL